MENHIFLHKTLDFTMRTLEKPEYRAIPAVRELLTIYEKVRQKDTEGARKYPFIIVEGLDGSGKSTVAKRIAKVINGINWQSPIKRITNSKDFLNENAYLRMVFYSLGNYIAALEVRALLQETSVIMDRFWHSTAAFAIARAVHAHPSEIKMPSNCDKIYEWPEDLLKPDLVLMLDVDEDIRWARISPRIEISLQEKLLQECEKYRNNVIKGYILVRDPKMIWIDANSNLNKVLEDCLFHVQQCRKLYLCSCK